MDLILPYKIGDLAESKSFDKGYRGAWFRCKIHGMRVAESGHLECHLEYIDYPGENMEWIRLFQKNPACSKRQSNDQIMIRPSFPQWHWKDQVPEQVPDNDVVAIVYETWKVGDKVDWFAEGCYWSGKITKLLNEDMLEVELLKPPIGEGQRYDANYKDLRPTLDWSLAGGWTVPLSQAEGKCWYVVHLVHRKSTESETSESEEETSPDDGDKDNDGDGGGKQDVQLHVISSNAYQGASGSPIPKPSSAAKSLLSLNAQDNATLASMADLEPSSSSKSSAAKSLLSLNAQDEATLSSMADMEPSSSSKSSAAKSLSSLNAQDNATLTSMVDLEPSSSSKSRALSDCVQPDIGIIEQGMESSNRHEQAVNVLRQYQQRLAEVSCEVEELMERKQSMGRRFALLSFFRCDLDGASAKTK